MTRVVGVIGGGQLARMMTPAAINLGLELRVLASTPYESAKISTTALGEHTDAAAVVAFGRECDVITFDHEHVPQDVLSELVAAGVSVQPNPQALLYAQDKLAMRERLAALGAPVPGWARVTTAAEVDAFLAEYGGRAVAKTSRGGYDGKGVRVIAASSDIADWLADASEPGHDALLLEEFVSFRRELAQQIARRPSGESTLWPVVETIQANGVCSEVIAPAPDSAGAIAEMCATIAETIADGLGVTGALAVELFETDDDRILVNELAMRPHNSGHWSMDGALTSQFEQHLRAVLDLPLGSTATVAPWSVMVNILGGPSSGDLDGALERAMAEYPEAKFHLYGKEPRPGRKIGHVNVIGSDLAETVAVARGAAGFFQD
jgi:5-(carboxyamino)imidazole ribonucleotide synthase